MKMLKNWKIKENIIKVLKTYPIVLCSFFAIGILSIVSIHGDFDDDIIIKINFCIAVFLGLALILRALKLSHENFTKKIYLILLILGLLLSASYYFTLDLDVNWTITRTIILLFIEGLLFISLPFVKKDEKSEHFTNLAAGRLVISGLLYGIAYGGVAGILFALEELFGLDISYKIYSDSAIILATTFLPMLWLFGLDYKVEASTSKLYKVLLSYVCIPLLFVYSAVVYGFIIKIVFDGFIMPSSIIGHLVLWYSFVSIVVTYLARPYEENPITKFFYKWYPLISVLPIIIMFAAIFMRINQYAITINRYFLLLGGIWLALMFGYLIFVRFAKKKRMNIITTLMLALFALISIAGPISANNVSESSQIARLESIVSPYIRDESLDVSQMDDEDIIQCQDIFNYLSSRHEGYSSQYFNQKKIDFLTQEDFKNIQAASVNRYEYIDTEQKYFYANNRGDGGVRHPVELEDYRYLLNIDGYDFNDGDEYRLDEYVIQIDDIENDKYERSDNIIYIYKNDEKIAELSIAECYGEKMIAKKDMFGENPDDIIYETPDKSMKIILYEIEFRYDTELIITRFEGVLLFK